MTDADRFASCAGMPRAAEWRLVRHLFYTFEIDFEAVGVVVPEGPPLVEVRPGTALLSVGVRQHAAGQVESSPREAAEILAVLHVQPDLSLRMPTPHMSVLPFAGATDSEALAARSAELGRPSRHSAALSLRLSTDRLGADVTDADGPILSVRSEHPEPRYTYRELWGQEVRPGVDRPGVWEWDGPFLEHLHPARGSKLLNHPFWEGVDVTRVRGCYRRILAEPRKDSRERHYRPAPAGA